MPVVSLKFSKLFGSSRSNSLQQSLNQIPDVPSLSFSSATASSYSVIINGYDPQFSYSVSASPGSAIRLDGNILVSELNPNQLSTLIVSVTNTDTNYSLSSSKEFLSLPAAPSLTYSTSTTTTAVVTISNYESNLTYNITSTSGSVSRSDNTISITGLTQGQSITINATASNSSGSSIQSVLNTGASPEIPTLSLGTITSNSIQFNITNFNVNYSYTASSTAGVASRSGSAVTVSGLSDGQTITAFVTAIANGANSEQASLNGTTTQLPTGGSITTSGSYRIHTFDSSGIFTVYDSRSVEYLIVGGGGSGGYFVAGAIGSGGGGAGGSVISGTTVISSGTYPVSVGGGGGSGAAGSSSSALSQPSPGGGAGTPGNSPPGEIQFAPGGSVGSRSGGSSTWPSSSPGQINTPPGPPAFPLPTYYVRTFSSSSGGGGAGFGGNGGNAGTRTIFPTVTVAGTAGSGGAGVTSSISGSSVTYSFGGGGGGAQVVGSVQPGPAGQYVNVGGASAGGAAGGPTAGAGGAGSYSTSSGFVPASPGSSAAANFGGGGGASGYSGSSGSGGSGRVIIRYIV